jgi:hypothetical protein
VWWFSRSVGVGDRLGAWVSVGGFFLSVSAAIDGFWVVKLD